MQNDEWCTQREKLDAISYQKPQSSNFQSVVTAAELLSPVLSDTSGAIYMKQLFLTLKEVVMSSMGLLVGKQSKGEPGGRKGG